MAGIREPTPVHQTQNRDLSERRPAGGGADAVDASTINVNLALNDISLHDVLDAVVYGRLPHQILR